MAWFNFGKTQDSAASNAAPETADTLRKRAKRRLIGAVVLVLAAVGLFPLVFDTKQRPTLVDAPIEIPDKTKVKPLPTPPAGTSTPAPAAKVDDKASLSGKEEIISSTSAPAVAAGAGVVAAAGAALAKPKETAPEAKKEAKPATAAENTVSLATKTIANPVPVKPSEDKAAEKAAAEKTAAQKAAAEKLAAEKAAKAEKLAAEKATAAEKAAEKKAAAEKAAAEKAKESSRAQALLEGKPNEKPAAVDAPTAATGERFIVQFGSFSDTDKARQARQKVERNGLKTYAQVAETADGKRIRVRVGPFATRAEAEKAASKIKGLDLPAAILTL